MKSLFKRYRTPFLVGTALLALAYMAQYQPEIDAQYNSNDAVYHKARPGEFTALTVPDGSIGGSPVSFSLVETEGFTPTTRVLYQVKTNDVNIRYDNGSPTVAVAGGFQLNVGEWHQAVGSTNILEWEAIGISGTATIVYQLEDESVLH